MPDTTEAYDFHDRTVVDQNGQKIGKIDELYYDQEGGQPEWALVNTGMFGTKKSFVPIAGAQPDGEDLRVAVAKDQVKDAPRVDPDQELSEDEERALFEHYGVPYTTEGSTTAQGARRPGTVRPAIAPLRARPAMVVATWSTAIGVVGHDTSGPEHRRGDDPLGGGAARRHDDARERTRPAAQVRRDRAGHPDRPGAARGSAHRARADHRRQPRRGPVRDGHLRGGARGRAARGAARSWRSRPFRRSASASIPTPSPRSERSPRKSARSGSRPTEPIGQPAAES